MKTTNGRVKHASWWVEGPIEFVMLVVGNRKLLPLFTKSLIPDLPYLKAASKSKVECN
jgi:hypothetical protein